MMTGIEVDKLSTMISARKPLKMAAARRTAAAEDSHEQLNAVNWQPASAQGLAAAGQMVTAQKRSAIKTHKGKHPTDKGHAYAKDLDCDFFGTAFEVYHVSKRAKRAGGGREMGAASTWCGNLTLGIRHCNWIQKCCYYGTGSSRKFNTDNLLYLASRDGFFNNVFHHKCDLKGPTLTIVATADGRIFGGYASTPWSAGTTGKYADDPAAFLFILSDEYGRQSLKIGQSSTSAEDAVFHDSDLGPCWGRALGLQLDILAYSSSDFTASVKYRIPEGQDDRTFLAGSYNGWDIQEVGVWLV